ncbi:MAG: hypothetical protein JNG84_10885 [Archangium sp.]|nr:hypothetical protein [Archangium sp.]
MSTIRKQTQLSSVRNAAAELKTHLKKADGNRDGRVTDAEVKKYAKALKQPKAVSDALLAVTSEALKGKASKSIAVSVITKQVDDAMALINKSDKNRNGKLDVGAELNKANTLKSFKALAAMASGLEVISGKLTAYQLENAIGPWAMKANYTSESDYNPTYFSLPGNTTITASNAMRVLNAPMDEFFSEDAHENVSMSKYTAEVMSAADTKSFMDDLVTDYPDDTDSVAGWTNVNKLLRANLTDLKVVRVGPKDEDGSMATDQGLYAYVIVGKTTDGKTAGVYFGSVET